MGRPRRYGPARESKDFGYSQQSTILFTSLSLTIVTDDLPSSRLERLQSILTRAPNAARAFLDFKQKNQS
jgi:hypothetical protein